MCERKKKKKRNAFFVLEFRTLEAFAIVSIHILFSSATFPCPALLPLFFIHNSFSNQCITSTRPFFFFFFFLLDRKS